MIRLALPLLVVLSGCLVGARGQPSNVYQTIPARPYVEVGTVRSSVVGYGIVSRDARDTAVERLGYRAAVYGADAVVDVHAHGGCPGVGWFALLFLLPNCYAGASGVGVRWLDVPPSSAEAVIRMSVEVR